MIILGVKNSYEKDAQFHVCFGGWQDEIGSYQSLQAWSLSQGIPVPVLQLRGRVGDGDTPTQNFGDRLGSRVIYNFKEFSEKFQMKMGKFLIEIRAILNYNLIISKENSFRLNFARSRKLEQAEKGKNQFTGQIFHFL